MNRHDIIELILEHAINQAVYSEAYIAKLQSMSDADLDLELDNIEQLAIFGIPMPSF